jgi:CAAX protease family protein
VGYAGILLVFGLAAKHSALALSLGPIFPRAFLSFALLFAPLWFFGFGAGEALQRRADSMRTALAAILAVPFLAFAAGTPFFRWHIMAALIGFPVLLAGLLAFPKLPAKMTPHDAAALTIITAAYFLRWFQPAWPDPRLSLLPKLFLADVALYCFLAARPLDGAGYSLIPSWEAAWTGFREWLYYFPFALTIGAATGFIRFHPGLPHAEAAAAAISLTFLLVALPEELFFRAIAQNLLETRLGRVGALLLASALFGLSHFNQVSPFNWRYVLLATIAGIFYGRAWRVQRQIFASVLTHTLVDVVWSLWFR